MTRLFAFAIRYLLVTGLIIGLAGCSLLSDDFKGITIVNAMDEPLYALGVEKELSHRLDISFKIPLDKIASEEGVLLQTGASATLRQEDVIGEYDSDKALRLFLYEVRGDTAYNTSFRDFAPSDLEQGDFRIEVSGFPEN